MTKKVLVACCGVLLIAIAGTAGISLGREKRSSSNTISIDTEVIYVKTCPPKGTFAPDCLSHVVAKGETFRSVARRFSTKDHALSVAELMRLNPRPEHLSASGRKRPKDFLAAGERLTLPYVSKNEQGLASILQMFFDMKARAEDHIGALEKRVWFMQNLFLITVILAAIFGGFIGAMCHSLKRSFSSHR